MSIGIHLDTSPIPLKIPSTPSPGLPALSAAAAGQGGPSTGVAHADGPVSVTIKASKPDNDSDGDSNASPAVKALQKEIAQLQKQLTQEEQALHAAMEAMKGASDPAGLTVVATLQSAVATTNGQLAAAVTALAALLLSQGSAGSGALVKASA